MNCKHYRKSIEQAALDSLEASKQAKLNEHLAGCNACRKLLESEQRLVEVVDQGLAASVAGVPSPGFSARLRMRLAAESELAGPRAEWIRSGWILAPVAGLVALAALLTVIWPASRHRMQPQASRPIARAVSPTMPASTPGLPLAASGNGGALPASSPALHHRSHAAPQPQRARRRRQVKDEDQAPHFQVLVEPGQWREIVAAYRLAQSGHVEASALAQASDQAEQPEEMKPIEITPVAIAEIYPSKSNEPAGR